MVDLRKNKSVYLIAILAVVFISLSPLLSQASTASSELGQYDVICSSTGIKLVNTSDSNDSRDIHPMVHCSYCSSSDENLILYNLSFKAIVVNRLEDKIDNSYRLQLSYTYLLESLLPNAPPVA